MTIAEKRHKKAVDIVQKVLQYLLDNSVESSGTLDVANQKLTVWEVPFVLINGEPVLLAETGDLYVWATYTLDKATLFHTRNYQQHQWCRVGTNLRINEEASETTVPVHYRNMQLIATQLSTLIRA